MPWNAPRSQIILKLAQSAARVSALNRNKWFLEFTMLLLTCITAFTITICFGLLLFCLFQHRKKRSSTVPPDIELGLQRSNDHQYKDRVHDKDVEQYKNKEHDKDREQYKNKEHKKYREQYKDKEHNKD